MALATDIWQEIPGSADTGMGPMSEWLRVTRDLGLACYISPAGKRGPGGKYRPGFDHRWTIWFSGTLLAEGFTDDHFAARSACMQEVDRVDFRIREAIRAMDIRRQHGCKEFNNDGDCVVCGMGAAETDKCKAPIGATEGTL